jgi:hypothetical protein
MGRDSAGQHAQPAVTTRLGDIGQALGITAVAAGKLLQRLGYRSDKHVTDSAFAAGCGVRRSDGYALHEDELRELRGTDPGMSLLTAVEFITSDPAHRVALYKCCQAEDQSIGTAKDLALLERRAQAEGFQV